jgi:hypothetical protein
MVAVEAAVAASAVLAAVASVASAAAWAIPFNSLDHLVGAGEQHWWHFEAKRPRGLEIDHQLELSWCLHRQVSRLLALENAIDV